MSHGTIYCAFLSEAGRLRILSIDTSTQSGSIALVEDGALVAEFTVEQVKTHSRWLLKGVDDFLKAQGVPIEEIDVFAMGTGPGSFTGLRIGVACVKGLSWALRKPVIGVSTLNALAMNIPFAPFMVCPVLDARKNELYAALFKFSRDGCERLTEDVSVAPEGLFNMIEGEGGGPVIFLGGGLKLYEDVIRGNVKDAVIAPRTFWCVRASNIGILAGKGSAKPVSAEFLTPLYLRKY